jgi:hypothetical protein
MAVGPKKRMTFRSRLNTIRRTRQLVSDQIAIIDRSAPDGSTTPGEMVAALTLGVTGYIGGRSLEKVVEKAVGSRQ